MTEQTIDYETGEILTPPVDPKAQAALFAKIAKVMANLERLNKTGYNDFHDYAYATGSDVSEAVRPALAAQGVAFFASMRHTETDGTKTRAHLTFTFADGETGATWTCNWIGEAMDKQDKATAKAATSGLKYFLLKTFILSTGDQADDTDADAAQPKPKKKTTTRKPKAQSGNGKGGNVADEPMTQFWALVKQHKIDQTVAKSYLEKCGGDATKAKEMLEVEAAKAA